MNTQHHVMHCIFISFLVIACSQNAYSFGKNCSPPLGPPFVSDGFSTTRKSFAQNSELCIYNNNNNNNNNNNDNDNNCTYCKKGFMHRCTDEGWTPLDKECSPEQAFKPADKPKTPGGGEFLFQDEQQDENKKGVQNPKETRHLENKKDDYTNRQNDRLCKILTTC